MRIRVHKAEQTVRAKARRKFIAPGVPAQSLGPLFADPQASTSGLSDAIALVPVNALKAARRNARTHSGAQIQQIANSIKAFGFVVPLVVDESLTIMAGHGRYEAAKRLGLTEAPVVRVGGLSEAKRRAFALADNKIAQNAGWDRKLLATELPELT